MGCVACSSRHSESSNTTKAIDRKKTPEKKEPESDKIEAALVGQGESGKSTIFKQMRVIEAHESGSRDTFSREERLAARTGIYSTVLSQMKALVDAGLRDNLPFSDQEMEVLARHFLEQAKELDSTAPATGMMIRKLWAEEGLKALYKERDRLYTLSDGSGYYWDALDRLYKPDYVPTDEDIVRARIRSVGYEEATFTYKRNAFHIVDLGGQRSERRRWLEVLPGVTAVIFVCSLCEWDQRVREDPSTVRFDETTRLFTELLDNRLTGKCIIVLLNKVDLFLTKLQTPARDNFVAYFKDYHGNIERDACIKHVQQRFFGLLGKQKVHMSVHAISAIDIDCMKLVWTTIRQSLVQQVIGSVL